MPVTIVLDDSLSRFTHPLDYNLGPSGEVYNVVHNTFKGSHPLHGFVLTVHEAFARHLELKIKPDDIWTLIVQGIAEHVNMDPEKYREKVVDFTGKKELKVETIFPVDWEAVLPEFEKQINENTKSDSFVKKMVKSYSTSLPINSLVCQTAVMSTTQAYFNYRVDSYCGIRKFTLLGDEMDWVKLDENLCSLNLYDLGLEKWDHNLKNIVKFFLKLLRQKEPQSSDLVILKSFYKFQSNSGGDKINGWILNLFPYLGNKATRSNNGNLVKHLEGEPFCHVRMYKPMHHEFASDIFGTGLNKVPFKWEIMGIGEYDMFFVAGFDVPTITSGSSETAFAFGVASKDPLPSNLSIGTSDSVQIMENISLDDKNDFLSFLLELRIDKST